VQRVSAIGLNRCAHDRAETDVEVGEACRGFQEGHPLPVSLDGVLLPFFERLAAPRARSRRSIRQEVGRGSRRNVERDALTGKGDLSKRISPSMTQPAPQASSYIVVSLSA
jgi:hypothetical protein